MKILSFFRRILTPGNIVCVALAATLIFLLFSSLGIVRVTGNSMDPTLADGQFLVGLKINGILPIEVSRGDIVTILCEDTDKIIIKRVIALPGDRVELSGGQLYLNGKLQYEPYIYEPMNDTPFSTMAEFTVPDGAYFVLGDNRNISHDSRAIGCIQQQELQTLIPLRHQAPAGAIIIVCILLVSWLADSCASFVDLRWKAYAEAKKEMAEEDMSAETEAE